MMLVFHKCDMNGNWRGEVEEDKQCFGVRMRLRSLIRRVVLNIEVDGTLSLWKGKLIIILAEKICPLAHEVIGCGQKTLC